MKHLSLAQPNLPTVLGGFCAITAIASFSAPATAQDFSAPLAPVIGPDVINAVTQGFRNRDRNFFEDGIEQFEHNIEDLQADQPPTPFLTVEPTPESWQQFFEGGVAEPTEQL